MQYDKDDKRTCTQHMTPVRQKPPLWQKFHKMGFYYFQILHTFPTKMQKILE